MVLGMLCKLVPWTQNRAYWRDPRILCNDTFSLERIRHINAIILWYHWRASIAYFINHVSSAYRISFWEGFWELNSGGPGEMHSQSVPQLIPETFPTLNWVGPFHVSAVEEWDRKY